MEVVEEKVRARRGVHFRSLACFWRKDQHMAELSCLDNFLDRLKEYNSANLRIVLSGKQSCGTHHIKINLLNQMRVEFKHAPSYVKEYMQLFDKACLLMLPDLLVTAPPEVASDAGIPVGVTALGGLGPMPNADQLPQGELDTKHLDAPLPLVRVETPPGRRSPSLLRFKSGLSLGDLQARALAKRSKMGDIFEELWKDADGIVTELAVAASWCKLSDLLDVMPEKTIQAWGSTKEVETHEIDSLPFLSIWHIPELVRMHDQNSWSLTEGAQKQLHIKETGEDVSRRLEQLVRDQLDRHVHYFDHFAAVIADEMLPAFMQTVHQLRDVVVQDVSIGQSMHEKFLATLVSCLFGILSWMLQNQATVWSWISQFWESDESA